MSAPAVAGPDLERLVEQYLVCPQTHARLTARNGIITCARSGFQGAIRDGVAVMMEQQPSFFDDKFHIMQHGHADHGEWQFCYQEQVRLLEKHLKPGMIVADIGCGPSLAYKPNGAFVIGLDPSLPSIRNNTDVHLRVLGSATSIPLADSSVDMVVCFYSVHHLVGSTREENYGIVSQSFRQFARIIKPGGTLFVFEMTPMRPAALIQQLIWNPMRRLLGAKLDMHFWTADFFEGICRQVKPEAVLERIFFQSSFATVIRPAFSVPELRLYRFLYPLTPKLYKFLM
jgi:ubiquinone/menaquinone biosynthesis C-methylase UbiE